MADPRHAQLGGVALWARVCLGELTLDETPALVGVSATFTPSVHVHAYAQGYAEYRKLLSQAQGALPPAELKIRNVVMMAKSPDSGEARRAAAA